MPLPIVVETTPYGGAYTVTLPGRFATKRLPAESKAKACGVEIALCTVVNGRFAPFTYIVTSFGFEFATARIWRRPPRVVPLHTALGCEQGLFGPEYVADARRNAEFALGEAGDEM